MATTNSSRRWVLRFNDPDDNYVHEIEVKSRGHFSQISEVGWLIWVLEAFENSGLKIKNWNVADNVLIIEHEKDLTSDRR